jgi:YVTN family beta-propeller protein
VIDAATNGIIATITGLEDPDAVAITPDKSQVWVGSPSTGTIYIISTATNKLVSSFQLTASGYEGYLPPYGMVFSKNGSELYVTTNAGIQGANVVVAVNTGNKTGTAITGFSYPQGIAMTPDGTRLYVTNWQAGSVSVVSTATDTVTQYIYGFTNPTGITINPAGTYAYVSDSIADEVSVLDLATSTVTGFVYGCALPSGVAISPGGNPAYILDQGSAELTEFSTATDEVLAYIPLGATPRSMVISPDGTRGYVTSTSGTAGVKVVDLANNTVLATIQVGPLPLGIALDP